MSEWMRGASLMILPALAVGVGNAEPSDNDDLADSITTIRLTIGTQTVDITEQGASRAVDVPRGNTTVDASFLNANGNSVTLPSNTTYAIQIVSQNTSRLTFTRTAAFSGTFNGLQTGTDTIELSHLHGPNPDFDPRNETINVLPATDG